MTFVTISNIISICRCVSYEKEIIVHNPTQTNMQQDHPLARRHLFKPLGQNKSAYELRLIQLYRISTYSLNSVYMIIMLVLKLQNRIKALITHG